MTETWQDLVKATAAAELTAALTFRLSQLCPSQLFAIEGSEPCRRSTSSLIADLGKNELLHLLLVEAPLSSIEYMEQVMLAMYTRERFLEHGIWDAEVEEKLALRNILLRLHNR